jgi:hypothetical protein
MAERPRILILAGGLLVVCGFPSFFGLSFCISNFVNSGDVRFLTSGIAEGLVLAALAATTARSLIWLHRNSQTYPVGNYVTMVNLVSAMYLVLIAITLANASTSGLFAERSRLEYYFANDWFRRVVTLSTLPAYLAAYHSIMMLVSPALRRQRPFAVINLVLLMLSSLLAGSRGSAVLVVATAGISVIAQYKTMIAKFGLWLALGCAAYLTLYLVASDNPGLAILGLVDRFYLSIDTSLLVADRSDAAATVANLNNVWIESFRNLQVFGAKPSPTPIGVLIYEHAFGNDYVQSTGANCRFASLLLLYPDRLDYLIGYPTLVLATAFALETCLRLVGLAWSSRIATPYFAMTAFQDVYWFGTHILPIALILVVLLCIRAALNASVNHHPHAQ